MPKESASGTLFKSIQISTKAISFQVKYERKEFTPQYFKKQMLHAILSKSNAAYRGKQNGLV